MEIAFVLLAHGSVRLIIPLIRMIVEAGHKVVVHMDDKSPRLELAELERHFSNDPSVRFAERVRVEWGEWSVVQATLNCLKALQQTDWAPGYVYLLSGTDYPIRSSKHLQSFLERNYGDEFIESIPSEEAIWVKSGPQRERYLYRWYFNWRSQPNLTEAAFAVQRSLGLRRKFYGGMPPHLGSQWWVLTWPTVQKIMRLADEPGLIDFFKTTLIPDELFFQTLVRQVAEHDKILGCPLTLYQFSDYGYPVVYHADHLDYLVRQRFFFARKLSQHDDRLRQLLAPYWKGEKKAAPFDDEDVGIRSSEYEDWRLAYREGPPNRPLVAGTSVAWSPSARRMERPYFAVVGTSVTELRFVQRILSKAAAARMHGLLFHPNQIEFADGAELFAGYGAKDTQLRDDSMLTFLSDVVRAEADRMTGFLLRAGHGRDLVVTLLQLPSIKFLLLAGDPLVSFFEAVAGVPEKPEACTCDTISPEAAANRFRVFLKDYIQTVGQLDSRYDAAKGIKPKGWMEWLHLSRASPNWVGRLEDCLGMKLDISKDEFEKEVARTRELVDKMRQSMKNLLCRGGVDPAVFDVLAREARNSTVALSLL